MTLFSFGRHLPATLSAPPKEKSAIINTAKDWKWISQPPTYRLMDSPAAYHEQTPLLKGGVLFSGALHRGSVLGPSSHVIRLTNTKTTVKLMAASHFHVCGYNQSP